jgi:hypothetical protein
VTVRNRSLSHANYKNGIFTRGVLFDVPRLKGKLWLEPGEAIYPEDLDAWLKKTGVKLEPGDVIFIRTGRWATWAVAERREHTNADNLL